MAEFMRARAGRNITGLSSRRMVRAAALAVALSMLMLGGLTGQAFSAEEQLREVQTLKVSGRVSNTGKMQKTERPGAQVSMLTVRCGGEESVC